MTRVLILAAPGSGTGKTTLTLGILRALSRAGVRVRAAKAGPDYIDPAFHEAASGYPSVNLDAWAMSPDSLRARAEAQGADLLIVEGAMGVLDGAADGQGSVADLARVLGAPVVMILDIAKTGQSAALAVAGLRSLVPELALAGVILNRAGSERHVALARTYLPLAAHVFGALPRDPGLALPERHLGLVQAGETEGLEAFLDHAADRVSEALDLEGLMAAARPLLAATGPERLPPPGQRIALARDQAFTFIYPHLLDDWRAAGAEILPFSPLADEAPDAGADVIVLPGGYPELHAGRLADAMRFTTAMKAAAAREIQVYGECGGYMVLGDSLIDADGTEHPMLGLLPHTTSFAKRRLSLGYRRLTPLGGPWDMPLTGHEFHYATIGHEGSAERLFAAEDASGSELPSMGLRRGSVCGSFAHVIGPAPATVSP